MAYFDRGGAHIYYEDTGGDGPAIVFSHGIFMDHEMFAPQVDALEEQYRCITWDERGHGDTTFEGSWSYWDLADDVVGLLDHLGIDGALLAGMSQGGFLSLRAALRAPERVVGLFLIDTQAGPEPENVLPVYQGMAAEWKSNGPNDQLVEAVAAAILGPADHEPWIKKWVDRPRDWVFEPFNTLTSREDITDRLPEIQAPAIVVHGTDDAAISMELAETLCSGLANCKGVVRVEGGGHASNLSHPDEVNAALNDFAGRHLQGTN